MSEIKIGFHYSRIHDLIPVPEFASLAEDIHLDSIWLPEGFVNEPPALDIMMGVGAFLPHTKDITVGTGVVILPLRHPAVLAKEVAALDVLSGGRLILGIGVGGPPDGTRTAFAACGVDLKERGARTDESLEIMTGLWSGRSVSHAGQFYRFDDVLMLPTPVQRPYPPIWTGGTSEPMLKRTARWANGFFPVRISADEYTDLWDHIQRFGDELGRDTSGITKAIHLFYYIADDRNEALRIAEEELTNRRQFYVPLVDDGRYPCGTGDDCLRVMEGFIEAGVTHFVFNSLAPMDEIRGQVERLGEEIIPHFN